MIGSLRGTILDVQVGACLLEVQSIGYEVRVSIPTLSSLRIGTEVFFYIHDHLREDAHDLYGFLTKGERELFEQLLGVSGVGPKVGLLILSAGTPNTVREAIMQGNLGFLTSLSGVGTKTAQKIILELKGQLVDEAGVGSEDGEVLQALVGLGYSANQVREALRSMPAEVTEMSERIRTALKFLAP